MAIIECNGTNGDWNDGTNNYVGGVAPGASDTSLFNATAGSQDIDTDVTAIAAIDKLDIQPGYTGALGGSGNHITTSFNVVHHVGTAALWLKDAATVTDDVFIQCLDPSTIVHLAGDTMTRVVLNRGTVTIEAGFGTIAFLAVGYVTNRDNDLNLTIVATAGTFTEYVQSGGTVTSPNTITDAYINGGIFNKTGTASAVDLNVGPGAQVNYNSSGAITWLRCLPGSFTDLGTKALTVTNSIFHPGSTVKFDANLVTFTNPTFDLRA